MGKAVEDLMWGAFGNYTVIARLRDKQGETCWLCKCSCGNVSSMLYSELKSGNLKKCCCECTYKISDYLRDLKIIHEWRNNTYTREKSKCQLTGKKVYGDDGAVHHLYGFNMIVLDAHFEYDIKIRRKVTDYTEEELKLLENYITKQHKNTRNAILLSKEVHILFHKEYGLGNNTPEQFEEFKQRYLNGEFDDVLGSN